MCFLSPENKARLKALKIPVELCLTSNILSCSSSIPSYADHHFALHHPHQPLALCTDDSVVFGSSLSQEYAIAMATFNLSKNDLLQMARTALDVSFLDRGSEIYANVSQRIQQVAVEA